MGTRSASSLAKGLRLLSALAKDQGRSSLSDVARSLEIPLPTAHRLALTLAAEGFLTRVRKGYYIAATARIAIPADETPARLIADRLRGRLFRLARDYQAFTHFGVLEEGMVTYLVKERGVEADLFTEERMQLEAYCSAVGKVLLAALPPNELEAYLQNGPFVALTTNTLTNADALRAEVEDVRSSGVGFDRCEIREDLFCMAVPVRDDDGAVIGAVSLSLLGRLPDKDEQRRIIRQLRATAAGPKSRSS